MIRRFFLIISLLQFSLPSCSSEISDSDFKKFQQVDCDTRDAFIYMATELTDSKTGAARRSFQFDNEGVLIRVPPVHYAPDYSNILLIKYDSRNSAPDRGLLSVKIKDENKTHDEILGIVSLGCVEKLILFLEERKINVPIDKN